MYVSMNSWYTNGQLISKLEVKDTWIYDITAIDDSHVAVSGGNCTSQYIISTQINLLYFPPQDNVINCSFF
jgi:hypothetical protein